VKGKSLPGETLPQISRETKKENLFSQTANKRGSSAFRRSNAPQARSETEKKKGKPSLKRYGRMT